MLEACPEGEGEDFLKAPSGSIEGMGGIMGKATGGGLVDLGAVK